LLQESQTTESVGAKINQRDLAAPSEGLIIRTHGRATHLDMREPQAAAQRDRQ
jgi:hypothetical protein